MSLADHIFEAVFFGLLIAAPAGLISGWIHWFDVVWKRQRNWRDYVGVICLTAVTLSAFAAFYLWLSGQSQFNSPEQQRTGEFWTFFVVWKIWTRPIVRVLAGTALLGFFSTRKLIAPVVLSSIGGIAWWILPLYMQ